MIVLRDFRKRFFALSQRLMAWVKLPVNAWREPCPSIE